MTFTLDTEQPQLAVFIGDIVDTSLSYDKFTGLMTQIDSLLSIRNVRWVSTGGSLQDSAQRKQQSDFDATFENSLTGNSNLDKELYGAFTSQISIGSSAEPLFKIFVIDTFSEDTCFEWDGVTTCISRNSVQWLREK
mmetsp:Transcript_20448/g.15070  ORF Transcript_20448/g.15070 Transcript_20448/m.15070 type:complete len:137 (+) Transcript_20448:148-558(+)